MVRTKTEKAVADSSIRHVCYLDSEVQSISRTRLGLWTLVSQIGALYYGQYLILGVLLKPLAACYFHREFLSGSLKDPK